MDPAILHVVIELNPGRSQAVPDVRFWVDCGFGGDLRSEAELRLRLVRRWRWTGTLLLEGTHAFFYRLGLRACAGASWSLRIHDMDRGCDVLVDGDRIDTPKSWLLGSCQLPVRAAYSRNAAHAKDRQAGAVLPVRGTHAGEPGDGAGLVVLSDYRRAKLERLTR